MRNQSKGASPSRVAVATKSDRSALAPTAARWLVLLAAAGWLGYFVCSGVPQAQPNLFRATIVFQAIAIIPAILYAGYLVYRRRLPGGSPLDWPLLAFIGIYLLATVASVAWRVSLESTLLLVVAILVFYVLSDLHLLDAPDLQMALMLVGVAAAGWALWNVAGDYGNWLQFAKSTSGSFHLGDLIPPTVPKVRGVGDHPNILGMTFVLIVPFYILAVYRSRAYWLRLIWTLVLLAALWTIFLTLSRGAWIGTAIAVAVTVAGIIVVSRSWSLDTLRRAVVDRLRRRPSLIAIGGIVLFFIVVVGAFVVATHWESRPQWIFRESLSPRHDVFDSAMSMFRDHPILGGGPGTFGILYPAYSGEYPVHAIHAHNGFLQVAVDAGTLGLAALAVLISALGWILWQTYRRGDAQQRLMAVACSAGLLGFAVHNLVDAANMWKTALVALAAVAAIAVKNYRSLKAKDGDAASQSPSIAQRLVALSPRALVAVAFITLPFAWGRIDQAHRSYSHSISQINMEHVSQAVAEGQKAVDIDPDLAIYQLQLGLAEGIAFVGGDTQALEPAITHLQRGVELDPQSGIGYANLARMLALADRKDEAQAAALEARRLAGNDSTLLLVSGNVLEDIGATQEAIETYGKAISRMSSVGDSQFWQESDFRRQHYAEIIAQSSLALSPCTEGNLRAQASPDKPANDLVHLRDDCILYLLDPGNSGDLDARVNLAEIQMVLKDYQSAYDHLSYVMAHQPDMARARTAMGEWYAASQGDMTQARAEWAMGAQLGDADSLILLGDSYPRGQVPADVIKRLQTLAPDVAGGARSYAIGYVYYRMKYSREAPATILLPGDWQSAVPGAYDRIESALARWRNAG